MIAATVLSAWTRMAIRHLESGWRTTFISPFLTQRFGVFASALFSCLSMLIDWSMFTSDFGAWYGRGSLAATLILGVLTLVAFRTSIGNRPVLRSPAV